MPLSIRTAIGLVLSLFVALFAYRRRSLSRGGVVGAVLTGTLTLGLGGWAWGLALIAFFISSSLLTRWRKERKAALEGASAKGGRRDLGQALANGGLAALLAVLSSLFPHPAWADGLVGALAAATADTWATEVGVLNPTPPRLITTGQAVPPGTSGGVTRRGLLAAAAGALFLSASFFLLRLIECGSLITGCQTPGLAIILLGWLGGFAGSLFDSLLGATVQAIYRCPVCGQETERRKHHGRETTFARGWTWLDNDWVNFLATVVGAGVAGVAGFWASR